MTTDLPDPADAQARLAAIVESSDDAIVSKSLDGIIKSWNRGAERIFGYAADEAIGQSINMLIPLDRRAEEPAILKRIHAGERVDHFETVRLRKDGTLIDVSVTISPMRSSDGRVIGASKIARDITDQKRVERELEAAKLAAESANRAKDRFLSILSHELRTPLTPLLSIVSLLENSEDLSREDLNSYLLIIRRNVETEARLVDDLLDITRIAQGKISLDWEAVDVHQAARNVISMMNAAIEAKQLGVTLSLDAPRHHIRADSGRLQQIFLNLLANSVKFTPIGGQIRLATMQRGESIVIEVSDSGIGILPDVLPRLFNTFEQGETSVTRQFGGLGLGLSIVRSLVTLHGGTVEAFSEGENRGALFRMTFPVTNPMPLPKASDEMPSSGKRHRLLLVEDHRDTLTVLSRLLNMLGYDVTTAESVGEATRLAESAEFDVLVSDIGLPDGSGVDVMTAIRRRQSTPGIALSGFGQADDIRRSEAAGFTKHLTKPVSFQVLKDALAEVTT